MLAAFIGILILSSFSNNNSTSFIGTYGVSDSDPSQIKLNINANHTYTYQDFSNPNHKIDVSGTWELKGKKVVLIEPSQAVSFHSVWTFVENGNVAKSHKGLCFYRLCKID